MAWILFIAVLTLVAAGLFIWMFWNEWPHKRIVRTWSWLMMFDVFAFVLGFDYFNEKNIGWPDVLVAFIFSLIIYGLNRLLMPIILRGGLPYRKDV